MFGAHYFMPAEIVPLVEVVLGADSDPVLGYALLTRFSQVLVGRLQATRFRLLDIYGTDTH